MENLFWAEIIKNISFQSGSSLHIKTKIRHMWQHSHRASYRMIKKLIDIRYFKTQNKVWQPGSPFLASNANRIVTLFILAS